MGQNKSTSRNKNNNQSKNNNYKNSVSSVSSVSSSFDPDNRKYHRQSRSHNKKKPIPRKRYYRHSRHNKNKKDEIIRLNSESCDLDRTGCSDNIRVISDTTTNNYTQDYYSKKESKYNQVRRNYSPIDICVYDCYKLLLLDDGTIIKESKSGQSIVENYTKISRIENYDGYLHGLGQDGYLYRLETDVDENFWEWIKCEWAPSNIYYICCDLSFRYLWIQYHNSDVNTGSLYNEEKQIETGELTDKVRRVYGKDKDHYLLINSESYQCMYCHPEGEEMYDNAKDGCLDYYNQVKILKKAENYSHIKMVNWNPEYY